jgi:hypothetical protein
VLNIANTNIQLSADEKKLIENIRRDFRKYKSFLISGLVGIALGLICIGSAYVYSIDDSYYLLGIYFITFSAITIKNSIRNKKTYVLLEKLLKDTESSD